MPRKKGYGFEYLPTAGVRTDLKRFMNKFLSYNTVRYEQFSEVWRERNMSYLWAGRGTDREAREFVEKVMQMAQEYFLPPFQFQVRVGGLYLLYAIYQVQPLIPKVKLRMTPAQWQDTVSLQQQAAQQNHLDAVYVFQRLLQEQAFLFCYTPSEMSIHWSMKDVDDREENLADNLREEKTAVVNLFNYESLEKLSFVQDQYQQMKICLAGQNATKPDKSLDVVHGELVEDIVVLLQSFKERVSSFSKHGQRTESSTTQEAEPVTETTGGRRQQLKSQASSHLTAHADKRHKLVVLNTAGTSTKTTPTEAGDADSMMHTDPSLSVSKNVPKSASKLPVIADDDSDDNTSSTDNSDEDYQPPTSLSSTRNNAVRQIRQEDRTRKSPQKKETSAKGMASVMKPVTASSWNIKELEKSHYSMPVIVDDTNSLENNSSINQSASQWSSAGKEVQITKQCHNKGHDSEKKTTEVVVPVRKRGRPRKYCNSNETTIQEILVTPVEQLHQFGKENPSQTNKTLASTSKSKDRSDTHVALANKIAFKWKKAGQADQPATTTSPSKGRSASDPNVQGTPVPVRKRGRPRIYCDPTKPIIPVEVMVYPKVMTKTKTGRYEVLYFPAGMKPASSLSGGNEPGLCFEAGNLSQAVQQWTSKINQKRSKYQSETTMATPALENPACTKKSRRSAGQVLTAPETVTEFIMRKEIGKPSVVQSLTTHKKVDKTTHTKGIPAETDLTSNLLNGGSTGQDNLGQTVRNITSNEAIQKLKERCKRKREESEIVESVSGFLRRCMKRGTETQASTTLSSRTELASRGSTESNQHKRAGIKTNAVSENTTHSKQIQSSSQAKNGNTTSDIDVPPMSSQPSRLHCDGSSTTINSGPKPKLKHVNIKLDASSVQYRFL